MTADPWDLPTPLPIQRTSRDTVDMMIGDIHHELLDARFDDPALSPDLIHRTLTELGSAAVNGNDLLAGWASDLLAVLWNRARTRVPWDEPAEPAWSLDPDPRHIPRSEGR